MGAIPVMADYGLFEGFARGCAKTIEFVFDRLATAGMSSFYLIAAGAAPEDSIHSNRLSERGSTQVAPGTWNA